MATKRPAKTAKRDKSGYEKRCPKCQSKMAPVRFVRQTRPSGMYWLCDSPNCGHEVPTR